MTQKPHQASKHLLPRDRNQTSYLPIHFFFLLFCLFFFFLYINSFSECFNKKIHKPFHASGRGPLEVMATCPFSSSPVPTAKEETPLLWSWLANHTPAASNPTKTVWEVLDNGNVHRLWFHRRLQRERHSFWGLFPLQWTVSGLPHQ